MYISLFSTWQDQLLFPLYETHTFCQILWIHHQSPRLSYGSPNLPDKINFWAFLSLSFCISWVYLCSSVSISKHFGCCSCFMFETGDKCEIYFLIAHVPLPCQLILVCTLIFFLPSLDFRKSVWNLKFHILFFKIHQSNIIVLFNHFLIPITCTCSELISTFTVWD